MNGPAASVVVATRNRSGSLARLVAALGKQQCTEPFEVVVVDDGSTDGTMATLEGLRDQAPFPVTVVHLDESVGPGAARNAGWRAARAPLIAFTDDDCAPQPDWLARVVTALGGTDVVQGRTVPDPAQMKRRNAFSHTVFAEGEWGFYEACNMGYRREVLEQLDGFHEGFRYALFGRGATGPIFGEDTDLAWRAKRAGGRVTFDPDAVVFHDVRRQSYLEHLRGLRRSEGVPLAIKRVPELRELCRVWVFWRPAHPLALLAAGGMVAAATRPTSRRRWLLASAAIAPYVRYRTTVVPTGRPRNRPVVIPLTLLSDLVETAVMAAGSIRYRTLVL